MNVYLSIATAPIILWALFLMYCALIASRKSGKLAATPWYVRWMSWVLLGVMGAFDVFFNVTFGSLMFLEAPSIHRLTFTQRCESHLGDTDFRGEIARWVCYGWLNPFQAGHCGG